MKNNQGVSLAELSIVLAVIGLLLAAVVGGLGIRKSAELRGFMTDTSRFQVAIEGFDSKFSDLPGDMSDAYTHWTTDCANSGVPATDATRCNGNSDGKIDFSSADGGLDSESYRIWQHLVLSEFLGGGYSGAATTATAQADIGINIPASKRSAVGYNAVYSATRFRNEINLGAFRATTINTNSALSPTEAFAIDRKNDDGIPGSGFIYGFDGSDATATNCVLTGAYNAAIKTTSCILSFPAKF